MSKENRIQMNRGGGWGRGEKVYFQNKRSKLGLACSFGHASLKFDGTRHGHMTRTGGDEVEETRKRAPKASTTSTTRKATKRRQRGRPRRRQKTTTRKTRKTTAANNNNCAETIGPGGNRLPAADINQQIENVAPFNGKSIFI